jgi:hypothetical protein
MKYELAAFFSAVFLSEEGNEECYLAGLHLEKKLHAAI